MPFANLTKTYVEKLPFAQSGQVFYRDTILRGFGVRVGTSSKVYFVEGQTNRTTRRVTIGRADVFPPEVARKKAVAILGEMAGGVDPNKAKREKRAEGITVSQAFDDFFSAKTLTPVTVSNYRRTQHKYLADWADKKITEISRQMVMTRHQKISEEFGRMTANNALRHFRSVFNFTAAAFDEFPQNPVTILTQARAWHRERRRTRIISISDFPRWWKAVLADTDDVRDIILIALFTGMRRSEVVRLAWDDVNLVDKTLHLDTTKNGDALDLPLCSYLVNIIKARRERVGQTKWLFPSNTASGHVSGFKTFVKRIVEVSGVEFSMHDLRRGYVTIGESLDLNIYSLKRLLNHRTHADVTHGYVVASVERLRQPVERIAARILEMANAGNQGKPASTANP